MSAWTRSTEPFLEQRLHIPCRVHAVFETASKDLEHPASGPRCVRQRTKPDVASFSGGGGPKRCQTLERHWRRHEVGSAVFAVIGNKDETTGLMIQAEQRDQRRTRASSLTFSEELSRTRLRACSDVGKNTATPEEEVIGSNPRNRLPDALTIEKATEPINRLVELHSPNTLPPETRARALLSG